MTAAILYVSLSLALVLVSCQIDVVPTIASRGERGGWRRRSGGSRSRDKSKVERLFGFFFLQFFLTPTGVQLEIFLELELAHGPIPPGGLVTWAVSASLGAGADVGHCGGDSGGWWYGLGVGRVAGTLSSM